MNKPKLGIIGAGKLGMTLAQLARQAGYDVYIAGSGDPSQIALSVEVLAPGAAPVTSEELCRQADVVVLALPLKNIYQLPGELLRGKTVIDATNHWWETDGDLTEIVDKAPSTSEAVQQLLPDVYVIKALSHMSYHDLHDYARPTGDLQRKSIAIAGDNKQRVDMVAMIVDDLGFEPLYIGLLPMGKKLEPGGEVFGIHASKDTLRDILEVHVSGA